METVDEIHIKALIGAIILGAISAFLFIKFQDKYYYFASFLLISALVLITWSEDLHKIEPLKLSIILTAITTGLPILCMYIAHYLEISARGGSNSVIGIITSQIILNFINKNLEPIKKIYNKYFIK